MKMKMNGMSCCNCGHIKSQGDDCLLETAKSGGFFVRCRDCGVESNTYGTAQKAADDFFGRPRMITLDFKVDDA